MKTLYQKVEDYYVVTFSSNTYDGYRRKSYVIFTDRNNNRRKSYVIFTDRNNINEQFIYECEMYDINDYNLMYDNHRAKFSDNFNKAFNIMLKKVRNKKIDTIII